MIDYIIAQNPDSRILQKASAALHRGEVVCLPTDTNWVLICDPFNKAGVEKLYQLRRANVEKHFSLLCDTLSRASGLARISTEVFRLIKNKVPGNYTFIFEADKKIIKYLKASKKDHEIGIRFPPSHLVDEMIRVHEGALLSANVTLEMLGIEDSSIEIYPYLIEESIGHQIAQILDPGEYSFSGSSTVVSFVNDEIVVLREGAGDPKDFQDLL